MRTLPNNNVGRPGSISISDQELSDYVSGSLGRDARAKIEGYLACNPDLAARIMGDLHKCSTLARPLQRPVNRRRSIAIAALLGGILQTILIGSVALAERWGSPFNAPDYVEDALWARRTTLLRVEMTSQAETPAIDAEEIGRIVGLRLPSFPASWRVIDAQLFPSDEGPSVSLLLDTGNARPLHLFAVKADSVALEQPTVMHEQGEYVAYWEVDGIAYTLSGEASREDIVSKVTLFTNPVTLAQG